MIRFTSDLITFAPKTCNLCVEYSIIVEDDEYAILLMQSSGVASACKSKYDIAF